MGRRTQSRGGSVSVPQLKTNIELSHRYRYTSTAGTLTTITDSLLLTAAGVSARTSTLGDAIFQSVKVVAVEIWTPPASQGAAATCSILWPSTNTSPAREVSDTTVSTAVPAHVRAQPPPNSLCGFWQEGTEEPLFSLIAPPGSIIDVTLALIALDGDPPTGTPLTATLVAANPGSMYYCSLDSNVAAGSIYKPVSLTSA